MYNIFDYMIWRSDLSFEQSPINEIDFAIFSQLIMLSYPLHFEMPQIKEDHSITIAELGKKVLENKKSFIDNIGLIIPPQLVDLVILMGNSKRYKDLVIRNYISNICLNKETQFTALTIDLDEEKRVVVFSGTDDTIIGWKENFNMMFTFPTEAQSLSEKYLRKLAKDKKLYIVGHSKGGNLAMFSTLHCPKKIFDNIIQVYCYDAPGLSEDIKLNIENKRRLEKIISYSPQTAIIGRLFHHYETEIVVHSKNLGLYQHDLLSWEVEVDHFKYMENRDKDSIYIEKKINTLLENMSPIMREEFVEIGYGLFLRTKSQTLSELNRSKIKLMKQYLNIEKDERKILDKTLMELIKDKIIAKNIIFIVKETFDKGKERKKFIKVNK